MTVQVEGPVWQLNANKQEVPRDETIHNQYQVTISNLGKETPKIFVPI